MNFTEYLIEIGLQSGQHVVVHASFKQIKNAFPIITPQGVISSLLKTVGQNGSIIFPTFTYCFKKSIGEYEIFDPAKSFSKVGLLSETFRLTEDVKRTSSPTHSFSLWGKAAREIPENNSPESPLGRGSILEWLNKQDDSFALMLGTNFTSLSFGHFLEIEAKVPWYDFSPWSHLNVLPIGVSILGEQKFKEIPGCSKSFLNFEKNLLENKVIKQQILGGLNSYLISIRTLYNEGLEYFKKYHQNLLCPKGECKACDSRRKKYLEN